MTLASTDEITGADVSSAQGPDIDYAAVERWVGPQGETIEFMDCKATEGRGYIDPTFAHNWAGIGSMRDGTVPRGAYGFAHPNDLLARDPEVECELLVRTVEKDFRPGVDYLALDCEDARHVHKGAAFVDWVDRYLTRGDELTGQRMFFYGGGPFFDENAGPAPDPAAIARIVAHPLWLAAYVGADPSRYVPAVWRKAGALWTIHQRTGDIAGGTDKPMYVFGIGKGRVHVDRNVFVGTVGDLCTRIRGLLLNAPPSTRRESGIDWAPASRDAVLAAMFPGVSLSA